MLYRISIEASMTRNEFGEYEGSYGHQGYDWCASKREVARIVREHKDEGRECEVESFPVPKGKRALIRLLNHVADHADNGAG